MDERWHQIWTLTYATGGSSLLPTTLTQETTDISQLPLQSLGKAKRNPNSQWRRGAPSWERCRDFTCPVPVFRPRSDAAFDLSPTPFITFRSLTWHPAALCHPPPHLPFSHKEPRARSRAILWTLLWSQKLSSQKAPRAFSVWLFK